MVYGILIMGLENVFKNGTTAYPDFPSCRNANECIELIQYGFYVSEKVVNSPPLWKNIDDPLALASSVQSNYKDEWEKTYTNAFKKNHLPIFVRFIIINQVLSHKNEQYCDKLLKLVIVDDKYINYPFPYGDCLINECAQHQTNDKLVEFIVNNYNAVQLKTK